MVLRDKEMQAKLLTSEIYSQYVVYRELII